MVLLELKSQRATESRERERHGDVFSLARGDRESLLRKDNKWNRVSDMSTSCNEVLLPERSVRPRMIARTAKTRMKASTAMEAMPTGVGCGQMERGFVVARQEKT